MSAYRDDQRVSSAPENSGSNDGASRRNLLLGGLGLRCGFGCRIFVAVCARRSATGGRIFPRRQTEHRHAYDR